MVRRPRFRVNPDESGVLASDAHASSESVDVAGLLALQREKKKFRDWDEIVLSTSIRACGILWPALRYRGALLDGTRRMEIARLQGKDCPVVDVVCTTQAARLLYRLHPERAWVVFVRRGMTRRVIADLFGVSQRELPVAQTMRTRARRRR